MTQAQENGNETPQDADRARVLQELLSEQTREVEALAKELAASYKKEIVFFGNLEQRDAAAREAERGFLKKIWWLETEWRRTREALQESREAQASSRKKIWWLESDRRRRGDELQEAEAARDSLRSELETVRAQLETVTAQRDALRDSATGRAQRAYWTARKRLGGKGRTS